MSDTTTLEQPPIFLELLAAMGIDGLELDLVPGDLADGELAIGELVEAEPAVDAPADSAEPVADGDQHDESELARS
jgi:hypothetical protein